MKDKPVINTGTDMSSIVSDPADKGIIRDMQAKAAKTDQQIEGATKDMESLKAPEMPKMPEAPKQSDYSTDPMKTWGSAAMMIGTLGSLLTRKPMVTALNSAAAVNKAAAAGDANAYKSALDKWKTDSDYAMKLANFDMDKYKAAVSKDESEIRAYSSSFKNDTAARALDMRQSEQHLRDVERQNKQMEESFKAQADKARFDYADMAVKDAKAKAEKDGAPFSDLDAAKLHAQALGEVKSWESGKADKTEESNKISSYDWDKAKPDDSVPGTGSTAGSIKIKALGLLRGDTPSKVGLGYGKNPDSIAAYNYLAHVYPSFDIAKAQEGYGEQVRELNAIATRSAPVKIAIHEIDSLAPPMVKAIKDLNPGEYPDFNALENAAKKKTGSPEVVAAYNAVQAYKNAMTQLLTKGGQSTDAARDKVDDLVNLSFSTKQIEAVVAQSKVEANAVAEALAGAREDVIQPEAAKKSTEDTILGSSTASPLPIVKGEKPVTGKFYVAPDGTVAKKTDGGWEHVDTP